MRTERRADDEGRPRVHLLTGRKSPTCGTCALLRSLRPRGLRPSTTGFRPHSPAWMQLTPERAYSNMVATVGVDQFSNRCLISCGPLTRDARTWQITTLATLLAWNLAQVSLGAAVWPSLVAIATAIAAQVLATRWIGRSSSDLRSPLITGLSLALLLRGDALWVPAAAAAFAIGSKFLIRVRGKHLFNPAAFAIIILLQTGHAWVSPGQWAIMS